MTAEQDPQPTWIGGGITPGSGNVFADIGLPHPEEDLLKSELVIQIRRFIEQKGRTQFQATAAVGQGRPAMNGPG